MPAGESERGVGDIMRRAVHINAGRSGAIEGIRNLRQVATQRQVASQLKRGLALISIAATGPFEFKSAIVGDVDLFIGTVDKKCVGTEREAAQVIGGACLVKVSRGDTGRVWPFHDPARILGVD